jgi:hypothetical protein
MFIGHSEICYSPGRNRGDGRQNSHWKDNFGIGVMDPTFVPGESAHAFSGYDALFFEYTGWKIQRAFDKFDNPTIPFPCPLDSFVYFDAIVADLNCPDMERPPTGPVPPAYIFLITAFGALLAGACRPSRSRQLIQMK